MKFVVWIRTQLRIKANKALHRSRAGSDNQCRSPRPGERERYPTQETHWRFQYDVRLASLGNVD